VCASHAVIMSVNNSLYGDPILKFGTDAQRERFLAPVAGGPRPRLLRADRAAGGLGCLQPGHAGAADGEHYVVTGRKLFITNGREASFALVFAQTDRAKAHRGITALVVEKGTPGFSVSKTEDKLGIRASDTAELVFEECACRWPTASARRGRASASPHRHRRRAHRHRHPGRRDRGRRLRARPGLRARAQGLRRADRRAPDGAVDAGRHDHRHRRRPAARPAGPPPSRTRAGRSPSRRPWPSCSPPRWR